MEDDDDDDRRTESVAKFKVCEYSFITLSGLNLVLDVIPYGLLAVMLIII